MGKYPSVENEMYLAVSSFGPSSSWGNLSDNDIVRSSVSAIMRKMKTAGELSVTREVRKVRDRLPHCHVINIEVPITEGGGHKRPSNGPPSSDEADWVA